VLATWRVRRFPPADREPIHLACGVTMPDRRYSQIRQLGLLASIPALLVIAPLIGLFAGQWVEKKFHLQPWGTIVGLVLGFGAAVRETRNIIRKSQAEDSGQDGDDSEP